MVMQVIYQLKINSRRSLMENYSFVHLKKNVKKDMSDMIKIKIAMLPIISKIKSQK